MSVTSYFKCYRIGLKNPYATTVSFKPILLVCYSEYGAQRFCGTLTDQYQAMRQAGMTADDLVLTDVRGPIVLGVPGQYTHNPVLLAANMDGIEVRIPYDRVADTVDDWAKIHVKVDIYRVLRGDEHSFAASEQIVGRLHSWMRRMIDAGVIAQARQTYITSGGGSKNTPRTLNASSHMPPYYSSLGMTPSAATAGSSYTPQVGPSDRVKNKRTAQFEQDPRRFLVQ